jgi:hypothetical protein
MEDNTPAVTPLRVRHRGKLHRQRCDQRFPETEFGCPVQTSIDDERSSYLINVSVGPDTWN